MTPPPDVFSPARLGPLTLRNRIIKAATYENMAREGLVTEALIDYHVAHAQGGLGMTTVAYCAVEPAGRTDGRQIVWRDEAVPGLRRLTDAVHATGAAVSAQVGHSGPVNDPRKTGTKALAPSRYAQMASMSVARAITPADMGRVRDLTANAVLKAIESGFDAVELHVGHNYLLSAFLSPRLNRRRDAYGGSLTNRARFPREVLAAAREAAGDRIAVIVKMNMADGVRGGFDIDEAQTVAEWIEADGSVDAFEFTEGSSLLNPMYLFKGDVPLKEFANAMPPLMRPAVRMFGGAMLREYPYSDTFLLPHALRMRERLSTPIILLGGVTDAAAMDTAMAQGFEFVAMGRALLREQDLPRRIQADRSTRALCDHNNTCMATTFALTHCRLAAPDQRPGARLGQDGLQPLHTAGAGKAA